MDTRSRIIQIVRPIHSIRHVKHFDDDCISFISDTHHVKKSCDNFNFIHVILNLIPVLRWLPKYSFKNDLPGDISAGFTVAVMHIPQGKSAVLSYSILWLTFEYFNLGMAYGLLAGVSPSSGLYMAFFPTLVYFVFGTSRHISVGTLSVISMMTLKVVQTYATINDPIANGNLNLNGTESPSDPSATRLLEYYSPLQVVTACAFMCGIIQVILRIHFFRSIHKLREHSFSNRLWCRSFDWEIWQLCWANHWWTVLQQVQLCMSPLANSKIYSVLQYPGEKELLKLCM